MTISLLFHAHISLSLDVYDTYDQAAHYDRLVFKWGFNLCLGHVGRHRVNKFSLVSETKQARRFNLKKPKNKKKKKKKKQQQKKKMMMMKKKKKKK